MDMWLGAVLSVAVGAGLAAAAGLRVFVPLLLLGGAARFGWIGLAGDFQWLASDWVLAGLAAAAILEIAAYHVPFVDHLLDIAATPAAVLAGMLLTAAVVTDLPPSIRWAAAIIAGGGTAGVVQSLTSILRVQSTATTGGLGNPVLATLEWIGAGVTSIVSILVPALALAIVTGVLLLAVRTGRRLLRRRKNRGASTFTTG